MPRARGPDGRTPTHAGASGSCAPRLDGECWRSRTHGQRWVWIDGRDRLGAPPSRRRSGRCGFRKASVTSGSCGKCSVDEHHGRRRFRAPNRSSFGRMPPRARGDVTDVGFGGSLVVHADAREVGLAAAARDAAPRRVVAVGRPANKPGACPGRNACFCSARAELAPAPFGRKAKAVVLNKSPDAAVDWPIMRPPRAAVE